MSGKKRAARRSSKSPRSPVDPPAVPSRGSRPAPALLRRATVNRGGRPLSANPRRLISLRLPADVIAKWKATGPGWQTRMAARLSRVR